jgi:hypothetical protein
VLVGFAATCVSAQSNPTESNDNLYSIALRASILQMDKEWGHLGHTALDDEIEMPTDYRHMIVRKNEMITDGLPTMFEDHSVEFLDDQELVERYRKLKKSFAVLEVAPMRNHGSILKISVSMYWFDYKEGRMEFGYSDWSNVEFRYDCGKGKFEINSVKLGGI